MASVARRLTDFLDNALPQPQRRLTNIHHFVFFGKVHVKFATTIIITLKLLLTIVLSIYMFTGHYFLSYWLNVFYETAEVLALIALLVGYLKENPKWMWPYMAVEFTWLVMALIIYAVSVSTLMFPQRFYGWLLSTEPLTESSQIRSKAFSSAWHSLFYSVFVAVELSILLACNRYFDDENERKKQNISRPIIMNVDQQILQRDENETVVDMDPINESAKASGGGHMNDFRDASKAGSSTGGFGNPNFSLVDSEDEHDDHEWHRKGKKTNILA